MSECCICFEGIAFRNHFVRVYSGKKDDYVSSRTSQKMSIKIASWQHLLYIITADQNCSNKIKKSFITQWWKIDLLSTVLQKLMRLLQACLRCRKRLWDYLLLCSCCAIYDFRELSTLLGVVHWETNDSTR